MSLITGISVPVHKAPPQLQPKLSGSRAPNTPATPAPRANGGVSESAGTGATLRRLSSVQPLNRGPVWVYDLTEQASSANAAGATGAHIDLRV